MLQQPLHSMPFGSLTPQLEGAPCSQIHDSRITSPQIAPLSDVPSSAEEKGQIYEAAMDTTCSLDSQALS
jgi:hypothetical protein